MSVVELDKITDAIAWCRLGSSKSTYPGGDAFLRAKALGLLAQDPIWRATPQGEGVLIAAGLLDGEPTPERTRVTVLWAHSHESGSGGIPTFVTAFPDGLVEYWPEMYARVRSEQEERYREFVPDACFFTTVEDIQRPQAVAK